MILFAEILLTGKFSFMKKWIIALSVIVLCFIAVYAFIPNIMAVNSKAAINNNPKGIYRALTNINEWYKWWPGTYDSAKGELKLNDNIYRYKGFTSSSVLMDIENPLFTVSANVLMVADEMHTQNIFWNPVIPTSYNPVKRLRLYIAVNSLEKDLETILISAQKFYTDTVNLYGIKINRDFVKDSSLIFTYDSSSGYPSTEKIYSLVDELRNYISIFSAKEVDSPMLNIYTEDSIHYLTRVAIPTNKPLPSSGKIAYKWMLANGNILTADVQGNSKKVDKAFTGIDNYVHDFELVSPAIPYYKLITNRLAEKDSTKWKTRIYYPVMYYKD